MDSANFTDYASTQELEDLVETLNLEDDAKDEDAPVMIGVAMEKNDPPKTKKKKKDKKSRRSLPNAPPPTDPPCVSEEKGTTSQSKDEPTEKGGFDKGLDQSGEVESVPHNIPSEPKPTATVSRTTAGSSALSRARQLQQQREIAMKRRQQAMLGRDLGDSVDRSYDGGGRQGQHQQPNSALHRPYPAQSNNGRFSGGGKGVVRFEDDFGDNNSRGGRWSPPRERNPYEAPPRDYRSYNQGNFNYRNDQNFAQGGYPPEDYDQGGYPPDHQEAYADYQQRPPPGRIRSDPRQQRGRGGGGRGGGGRYEQNNYGIDAFNPRGPSGDGRDGHSGGQPSRIYEDDDDAPLGSSTQPAMNAHFDYDYDGHRDEMANAEEDRRLRAHYEQGRQYEQGGRGGGGGDVRRQYEQQQQEWAQQGMRSYDNYGGASSPPPEVNEVLHIDKYQQRPIRDPVFQVGGLMGGQHLRGGQQEGIRQRQFKFSSLNTNSEEGMRQFLMSPCPRKAGTIQCCITRKKSGINKLFPEYRLYMKNPDDDRDIFLMVGKKRGGQKTSNYLISMDENDLRRSSTNYLGKLRANFVGTEFRIYDNGVNPDGAEGTEDVTSGQARRELAVVMYEANVMGSKGPRRMQVAIPRVDSASNEAVVFQPSQEKDGMMAKFKNKDVDDLTVAFNKPPRWNEQVGAFVLNFNGRVTMASVKNFQLTTQEAPDNILLQFGRISKDEFTMDLEYPITPFQAFTITLSSFDSKIACD